MAELDTRGAFDGFQKGFGLVDNYYARQHQQGLQDKQVAGQQKLVDAKLDETRKANQKELVSQYYTGVANGIDMPISDDLKQAFKDNPMVDPAFLFSEKTQAAVDHAVKLKSGEDDMFSPQTREQMNNFFEPRVNRGEGVPEGTTKSIDGVFPGQNPGTIAFNLKVTNPDGTSRNAPMTANRSTADDDHVAQYPIEDIIKPVLGAKQILDSISPDKKASAIKFLQDSGWMAKSKSSSLIDGPDGSKFAVDANGDYKLLLGRAKDDAEKPTDLAQFLTLKKEFGEEKAAQYMAMAKGKGLTSTSGGSGGAKGGTWSDVEVDANGLKYQDRSDGKREYLKNADPAKVGSKTGKNGNSKLSTAAQKDENEWLTSIGMVDTLNGTLDGFVKQIDNGEIDLGPVANKVGDLRNWAGINSEKSNNYSNFMSSMQAYRDQSLQLNKGVQTDGDAKRAWEALFRNINSPAVVKVRLEEIQRLNLKASKLKQILINQQRENNGMQSLDTDKVMMGLSSIESAPVSAASLSEQQATPSAVKQELRDAGMPALPKSKAEYDALPTGTPFINSAGVQKIKP
jgi:hypothetical protein